jgi:hypothetical protein
MKTPSIITLLFILISFSSQAQSDKMKEKREQIKSMKIEFLTTELNLSQSEADKFWPIYNAFEDKEFELKHSKSKTLIKKYNESKEKMTEKEASLLLNQIDKNEEELFLLRKKFVANLKGVIPPSKIILLKKSEEAFNRKLLAHYRNKAQQRKD